MTLILVDQMSKDNVNLGAVKNVQTVCSHVCMFQTQKLLPVIQKKINWMKMQLLIWIVLMCILMEVMLIFGMGLYGLFISNTSTGVPSESNHALSGSSLFGMFALKDFQLEHLLLWFLLKTMHNLKHYLT